MRADRPAGQEQDPQAATGLQPALRRPRLSCGRSSARPRTTARRPGTGGTRSGPGSVPDRHRILELGAGGGHNLSHLTADFEAEAVDLSPRMLEHSRRLNPDVAHHAGDMRTVRLGVAFDAVLIHDAVSYMLSEDDLRAAFATARAHLRPGGLLLVAPDLVRENFRDGMVLHWPIPPPSTPDRIRSGGGGEDHPAGPRRHRDRVCDHLHDHRVTDRAGSRPMSTTPGSSLIETWVHLMEESGFRTQVLPLPGDGDGCGEHLFSGTLRAEQELTRCLDY